MLLILILLFTFWFQGQQYVCAGELVALQTLTNVLNYLKVEKVDVAKVCFLFGALSIEADKCALAR